MPQPSPAPNDPQLSALVESTRGLQPWRRVFHAGNGILLSMAVLHLPLEATALVAVLAAILLLLVGADWVRLRVPRLNRLFFRVFSPLASPREAGRIASSTYYLLGVILSIALFPRPLAAAAILVLGLADPSASVVGQTWGRRSFGTGTLEGTLVFVIVAFLCLLPFAPWWAALPAAAVTALAELLPWPLDDNLVIPLTAGGVLVLLAL